MNTLFRLKTRLMRQKHIRSDQSSCQTIPAAFEVSKEGGGGRRDIDY